MVFELQQAKKVLSSTALPSAPELSLDGGMEMPDFLTAENQSLVVGSNALSFAAGVDAGVRQAIADSSLFAQLAAQKKLGTNTDPLDFFNEYFSTLYNIGWVIQEKDMAEHAYSGDAVDVHQAIVAVIEAFLEPVAGAWDVVRIVLDGLGQQNRQAPFITLFNQQSQHGEVNRFQFTYVYPDDGPGLVAKAMAFSLKTDEALTQVLFFKVSNVVASLRHSTGSLSIDAQAMKDLSSQLAGKMKTYRSAFIASVEL